MNEDNNDYDQYDLIDVKLPRKDLQRLEQMIKREESVDWLINWIRNGLVFVIGGGLLLIFGVWDWLKVNI
jgi:hypothetical protein